MSLAIETSLNETIFSNLETALKNPEKFDKFLSTYAVVKNRFKDNHITEEQHQHLLSLYGANNQIALNCRSQQDVKINKDKIESACRFALSKHKEIMTKLMDNRDDVEVLMEVHKESVTFGKVYGTDWRIGPKQRTQVPLEMKVVTDDGHLVNIITDLHAELKKELGYAENELGIDLKELINQKSSNRVRDAAANVPKPIA